MDEHGENRHDVDLGPCIVSDNVNGFVVQQDETDDTEVVVEEVLDQQKPSSTNYSNTDRTGAARPYRGRPRCLLGRFRAQVPSFGFADVATDVWSCTIVILTFWLFAAMIMVLGFYGSYDIELGPSCSYEIEANPFFAHSIKVQEEDDQSKGSILYGFHKTPSLDIKTTWSTIYTVSVQPSYHREWAYYLNAGSRIDIYYDVKFPASDPVSIVIADGRATAVHWMDDPSSPNTTLSWNIVHDMLWSKPGSGVITEGIAESDVYYVAVGNLNLKATEVYLNITIQSLLHNTSNADFKCYLNNRVCRYKLNFMKPNVAVLTTPVPTQVNSDIKVSFGPQWLTYCIGSCIVTVVILVMFRCCDNPLPDEITHNTTNQALDEREPLISGKSEDNSSMGSSYESSSIDEDDMEEIKDGGGSNSKNDRFCAICFDARKDCFSVPCGHSAACFTCGSRVAEEAGICPICRRKIKKVRNIFLV